MENIFTLTFIASREFVQGHRAVIMKHSSHANPEITNSH